MELEQAREYIRKHLATHNKFIQRAEQSYRYYRNSDDIKHCKTIYDAIRDKDKSFLIESPLRNANHRMSHNWHQLLINQKASYLFTYPPTFETGAKDVNQKIIETLGDIFPKVVKQLAIEASNTHVAWLHVWTDEKGKLHYASVPSTQVVPVFTNDLEKELSAVLRVYEYVNEKGKTKIRYEIWNDREAEFYESDRGARYGNLQPYILPDTSSNKFTHDIGDVPFIPFYNNDANTNDLVMYKDLIDQYDNVMSGFANDLEDIQEVIFVLRNYGGEDLNTFLSELKRYKAIKVEDGVTGDRGGVETMSIEIPVEARVKFLELIRKQIFVSGQGIDPEPEKFGNASGVALKYQYSLLEIKAGLMETEFRAAFGKLLRIVFRYLNLDENMNVQQIYFRNTIENDQELAAIARDSVGIISDRTIVQNHPWVEDGEAEIKQIKEERKLEEDRYGREVGAEEILDGEGKAKGAPK